MNKLKIFVEGMLLPLTMAVNEEEYAKLMAWFKNFFDKESSGSYSDDGECYPEDDDVESIYTITGLEGAELTVIGYNIIAIQYE